MFSETVKKYTALVVCMGALALLPFVTLYIKNNFQVPKVPVETTDDGLYYVGRAMEVSQGHAFIGNPYIFEHRDDATVAFFVADWIYAIPLFFGASVSGMIIWNQIFWFVVTGVLLYILLELLSGNNRGERKISWKILVLSVCACMVTVYWFEARPVAMQVVYPVFLTFLISFFTFLSRPASWKRIVFLGVTTSLALYVYTYLAQIAAVILVSCLILSIFSRYKQLRTVFWGGTLSLILSIPFLLYTWKQIHSLHYLETVSRIGLVQTHLFGFPALWYTCLALFPVVIVFLTRKSGDTWTTSETVFVTLLTTGLVVAGLSNVITGKDLETAVHIGRFTELWASIFFIVVCIRLKREQLGKVVIIVGTVFLSFILKGVYLQVVATKNSLHRPAYREEYVEPLEWLRNAGGQGTSTEVVVLANNSFASYIPVMTDDYVLFHPNAQLYLMSDTEAADRFLAARIFSSLSVEDIEKSYRLFAGAGHAVHRTNVHNRAVKLCNMTQLSSMGIDCGVETTIRMDTELVYGEGYFTKLQERFITYTSADKNRLDVLKKYQVKYVVFDTQKDNWNIATRTPSFLTPVFNNGRFVIFSVK